jgi:periplasmic protein TonB
METKKTPKADMENKKSIFLETGLIVALALSLLAFEWRTLDKNNTVISTSRMNELSDYIPVNTVQSTPLPRPQAAKPWIVINEVKDEIAVDDISIDISAEMLEKWQNPEYLKLPDEPVVSTEDSLFMVVEKEPEFPGGLAALYRYLSENIEYPKAAVEADITGTVYVGFVVEKNGTLSNIEIQRSPHQLLSEEAVRVISSMPAWSPGKQRGKAVRVRFSLPVKFSLQ